MSKLLDKTMFSFTLKMVILTKLYNVHIISVSEPFRLQLFCLISHIKLQSPALSSNVHTRGDQKVLEK